MSPSKIIHFGPSEVMFDRSLIMFENSPSFHSRVAGFMIPNNSSFVTAFGFKSVYTGFFFKF